MEPTNQGEVGKEVAKLSEVIQIDEGKIQEHLGEVVRSTVEETLNAMLDAEADRLCRAERYERTEARKDTRAGSYQRHLQTKAGDVTLKVPKLRNLPFETAIIERYRKFGGRSAGGDVSCGSERTTSRRHHRSAVGHASQPEYGQRAEPEDLRADRDLAEPADRRPAPVCVSGWLVAEAELGR